MILKPKYFVPLLVAGAGAAASIAIAPIAAAASSWPVAGDESASATINDLSAQGYNVQINGVHNVPLSRCNVTGIENPDLSAASRATFTTVYVDVSCPNRQD
jgi:hypothetical protein